MQRWLRNTLAGATGRTATLALQRHHHQTVQSAKSYINIYNLFSFYIPQILMQKFLFKGFRVILFQNYWLRLFSCNLLISFDTTPPLATGYNSGVALNDSALPGVCRINLWHFLLCRLCLSLSCLNACSSISFSSASNRASLLWRCT